MPETISAEKTMAAVPPAGRVPSDSLKDLDRTYVIEDRAAVADFISEHQLGGLLQEASAPLDAAFGSQAAKLLRLVCDDEGFATLFCLVSMPGGLERALDARATFDRTWWLDRCAAVAGKLNFDFELV
jgi:hypothetical protein